MGTGKRKAPRAGYRELCAEHREARRQHKAWVQDLERWRREYQDALLSFARRAAEVLELESYEIAADKHEAAIQAHEEILGRHERSHAAASQDRSATAGEFVELHRQLGARHERSRREHERIERAHRAALEALALLSKAQ